jgi:ribosomal-protein-alanine N-acetyltransferase
MIRQDMPDVLAIESAQYEFPWAEADFIAYMRNRNSIGMAAELNGVPVGFMLYEMQKTRLVLDNIAVHPDFTRRGIGRQMVAKLAGKLSTQRRTHIRTMVRESNLEACKFLAACGFEFTGVEREPYRDTDEDAYRFELWLVKPQPVWANRMKGII